MEKNFNITSNLVFLFSGRGIDMVDAALVRIDYDSKSGHALLDFVNYMATDRLRLKFEEVSLFQWIPSGDFTPGDYQRLDGCGYQDLWYIDQGDLPSISDERQLQQADNAALVLIFNEMTLRVHARKCSLSIEANRAIHPTDPDVL